MSQTVSVPAVSSIESIVPSTRKSLSTGLGRDRGEDDRTEIHPVAVARLDDVDRPIEVEIDVNHDLFAAANLKRSLRVDVDLLKTVQRYVRERVVPRCIGLDERQ